MGEPKKYRGINEANQDFFACKYYYLPRRSCGQILRSNWLWLCPSAFLAHP